MLSVLYMTLRSVRTVTPDKMKIIEIEIFWNFLQNGIQNFVIRLFHSWEIALQSQIFNILKKKNPTKKRVKSYWNYLGKFYHSSQIIAFSCFFTKYLACYKYCNFCQAKDIHNLRQGSIYRGCSYENSRLMQYFHSKVSETSLENAKSRQKLPLLFERKQETFVLKDTSMFFYSATKVKHVNTTHWKKHLLLLCVPYSVCMNWL